MKRLVRSILDTIFPRYCEGCNTRLSFGESLVCPSCTLRMERESFRDWKLTSMMTNFYAMPCVQRCGNFVRYRRHNIVANIVHNLKYYRHYHLGPWMGRLAASELASSHLFDDIDLIIPIPLSRQHRLQRGFNQSAGIALGISQYTGIPMREDFLVRPKGEESQTHFTTQERTRRVNDAFRLTPDAATILAGMRVMLVDDVLTTGTTMRAAVTALSAVPHITVTPFAWARANSY